MVRYDCRTHFVGKGPWLAFPRSISHQQLLASVRCLDSSASALGQVDSSLGPGSTMTRRYPSSLRSVKSARSLRRRSGTFGKNAQEETDAARAPSRSSARASSSSTVSGESRRTSTIVGDGAALSSEPRRRPSRRVSLLKDAPLPPCPHHLRIQPGTDSRIPTASTTTKDPTAIHNPSAMCP